MEQMVARVIIWEVALQPAHSSCLLELPWPVDPALSLDSRISLPAATTSSTKWSAVSKLYCLLYSEEFVSFSVRFYPLTSLTFFNYLVFKDRVRVIGYIWLIQWGLCLQEALVMKPRQMYDIKDIILSDRERTWLQEESWTIKEVNVS